MTLPQTRRGILRSSAALLLAGGVAASTVPEPPPGDAELLAMVAGLAATEQAVVRLEEGAGPGWAIRLPSPALAARAEAGA